MDLNQIVAEHEPIVQAIIDGDPDTAERAAREHNAPEVERAAAALAAERVAEAAEAEPEKPKTRSRQSNAA
jgi:hypothetical protein